MHEIKRHVTNAKLAKCPICANAPATHGDDYGDIHIYCCDMHTTSGRMWNKYVAAMTAEHRLAELKEVLRRIANYTAYGDYNEEDKKLFAARDRLGEDINNCAECARAREINWPPSGMCSTHYSAFMRIQDSIKHMHAHKEIYDPRNIAREALAKLEEK